MTSPRLRCRAHLSPLAAAALMVLLPALWLPAVSQTASQKPAQAGGDAANARRVSTLRASTPVTLNFVNADVEAVSRAVAVMIDRQILVDPRVKGVITLYSEQPMPVRDAYLQYLAGLRGLGFAVVDNAGLLKVECCGARSAPPLPA